MSESSLTGNEATPPGNKALSASAIRYSKRKPFLLFAFPLGSVANRLRGRSIEAAAASSRCFPLARRQLHKHFTKHTVEELQVWDGR